VPISKRTSTISESSRRNQNPTTAKGDVSNLGDLDRLFAQIKKEKRKLDMVFANFWIVRSLQHYPPRPLTTNSHVNIAVIVLGPYFNAASITFASLSPASSICSLALLEAAVR